IEIHLEYLEDNALWKISSPEERLRYIILGIPVGIRPETKPLYYELKEFKTCIGLGNQEEVTWEKVLEEVLVIAEKHAADAIYKLPKVKEFSSWMEWLGSLMISLNRKKTTKNNLVKELSSENFPIMLNDIDYTQDNWVDRLVVVCKELDRKKGLKQRKEINSNQTKIKCQYCHKDGHTESKCFHKRTNENKKQKEDSQYIKAVSLKSIQKDFQRKIYVGLAEIKAQIDTGADVCVISRHFLQKLQREDASIKEKPHNRKLR
ncbi:hypothetical protein ENBRE01_3051, partial [Enteropsectra breve]